MSASTPNLLAQPGNPICVSTGVITRRKTDNGRYYNQYYSPNGQPAIGGTHTKVFKAQIGGPDGQTTVCIKRIPRQLKVDKYRDLAKPSTRAGIGSCTYQLPRSEYRAQREVAILKAISALSHPNVVPLYEVIDDTNKKELYLVMEDLPGPIQYDDDAKGPPVYSVSQIRRIIRDVTLGLDFLHHYGIIHRDIKPANLLVGEDDIVKICDFSVSHVLDSERSNRASVSYMHDLDERPLFPMRDGSIGNGEGTRGFLAPEVVWQEEFKTEPAKLAYPVLGKDFTITLDDSDNSSQTSDIQDAPTCELPIADALPVEAPTVTKAIDIWSLGVTYFCLLFGHLPFDYEGRMLNNILDKVICTRDWVPEPYMGKDRIATGGRFPAVDSSEGSSAMQLLDGMLQKDPTRRVTVDQIKKHPWISRDLHNPKKWRKQSGAWKPKPSWVDRFGSGLRSLTPGRARSSSLSAATPRT